MPKLIKKLSFSESVKDSGSTSGPAMAGDALIVSDTKLLPSSVSCFLFFLLGVCKGECNTSWSEGRERRE